jgi:RNA-directed DNA polymerase
VFGDRKSGGHLLKFAWTNIVRHQLVMGTASPDDPALTEYWTSRRRKTPPPINTASQRLLRVQHGRCPICGTTFLPDDHRPQTPREWEQWLAATRMTVTTIIIRATGKPDEHKPRLIHASCRDRGGPALLPAREPEGLA